MDGARLFNAAEASGIPVKKICSYTDTLTFCLSKGLGAPVGSILCGSDKFIAEARRVRKLLGGGMRQAGILAAAGIYALENNINRLPIDHENARLLAETLGSLPWAEIDSTSVETNILYFSTGSRKAEMVVAALAKRGILSSALDTHSIRFVTHLGISSDDTREICRILKEIPLPR